MRVISWFSSVRGRSIASVAALLSLVLLLPACSSGGDGGDDSDPLACSLNTHFSEGILQNAAFLLQTASTPCGQLNLDVTVTSVSNIWTVGFDVTYPDSIFSYDGFTEGPLLLQGSPATPPFFIVNEIGPGRIAVFATRVNPDPGVDAGSPQALLTLRFRAIQIGEGDILFDLASTPVQEQVVDDQGGSPAVSFVNGSNVARVF